jgi:hypothetical protein
MAKVTRVGGRGTTRRKTDTSKKSTFSGDSYKDYQEAKKKAAGNRSVSTGRGTGKRKLSSTPTTKKASTKGRTRSTGRGTGSRKTSS